MTIEILQDNIKQMKKIAEELYVFTNNLNNINKLESKSRVIINTTEKKLLMQAINALSAQIRIINNSIPDLTENIGFYKKLTKENQTVSAKGKLIKIEYRPPKSPEKISFIISEKDKKDFLDNLSKSNLSITQLKKDYSVERSFPELGKPSNYAKIGNKLFKNYSIKLVNSGYFGNLNRSLRKINSMTIVSTYVSMIFLTMLLTCVAGIFLFILLLFFNISIIFPFISLAQESIFLRIVKFIWIVPVAPIVVGFLMYIYPASQSKNIGSKINQELPFVTIHMSAIANSGLEPLSIFKILLQSEEYKYTNLEFKKLLNLINFQGMDLVTALKETSRSSPSSKLKELFDGIATTITSGGNLKDHLSKHSEDLLFDYRLERERYTKASETFMDIYISIAIASPMILLMLFIIMGSTGVLSNYLGLSTPILSILIIFIIMLLNISFLTFLRFKQPEI